MAEGLRDKGIGGAATRTLLPFLIGIVLRDPPPRGEMAAPEKLAIAVNNAGPFSQI